MLNFILLVKYCRLREIVLVIAIKHSTNIARFLAIKKEHNVSVQQKNYVLFIL